MKFDSFQAWITSDGNLLPEFMVKTEDNTITCFIPSEVGKYFTIHWRDLGSGRCTATYINLDGQKSSGKFLNGSGEAERSARTVSSTTEVPFMFEKMACESQTVSSKLDASEDVGTIELKIVEWDRGSMQPAELHPDVPSPLGPEYGFATGGHTVAYGAERPRSQPMWNTTWGSKDKNLGRPLRSLIKFRWRYRPQLWLLGRSIVTLDPPTPKVRAASVSASSHTSPMMEGQGVFATYRVKVEDNPSPQGVMMNPSRSKKTTQSKKGKDVVRIPPEWRPAMASTGTNPLSIEKYFGGPAGQFSESELLRAAQYRTSSRVQQLPNSQSYQQRPSAVTNTTHSGMAMGSPSVSSDGSYPSGSATPATPQGQYWEVPIQDKTPNEPRQWVNLAEYPSRYHGEKDYNQSAYGKY